jgi:hypothetical protein
MPQFTLEIYQIRATQLYGSKATLSLRAPARDGKTMLQQLQAAIA